MIGSNQNSPPEKTPMRPVTAALLAAAALAAVPVLAQTPAPAAAPPPFATVPPGTPPVTFVTAAEVLPWGVRIECRLSEPAEEPLEIPVDLVAKSSREGSSR